MASGVGPSPFNGESVDIREETQLQRVRRQHEMVRRRRQTLYDEDGLATHSGYLKKPIKPPMKELTTSNGYKVYTPDVVDWDKWLDTFHAEESEMSEIYKNDKRLKQCQSLADLVDYAFNESSVGYDSVTCPEDSHILNLAYQPSLRILRVEFYNHSVVCYFYVPEQVYYTLRALAIGGQKRIGMDGTERHLVGIYFWDLIRLRGTVHGNRYDCCYITHGEKSGYVRPMKITDYRLNQNIEKKIATLEEKIADLKHRDDGSPETKEALTHLSELLEQAKSERYYVAHTRYPTPEEAVRIEDIRYDLSRNGGDPDYPIKTMLGRSGDSAISRKKLMILCKLIDNRAQQAFSRKGSGDLLAEYNELGKMREGDSDRYDGYLRKEEWLKRKGLWPYYK